MSITQGMLSIGSRRRLALATAVALAFVPTSGAYAADFVVANEAALRNAILTAGNTDTITFGDRHARDGELQLSGTLINQYPGYIEA
jgi:hypothetical protein